VKSIYLKQTLSQRAVFSNFKYYSTSMGGLSLVSQGRSNLSYSLYALGHVQSEQRGSGWLKKN